MRILFVGGIGYLGLNGVEYHARRGDYVAVVALERSIVRRPRISEAVKNAGADIDVLPSLADEEVVVEYLSRTKCPDIVYLLVGKIRGGWRSLYEANAVVPRTWTKAVTRLCRGSLVVYMSSTLVLGEPAQCSGVRVLVEEEEHLKCFRQVSLPGKSKAEGEKEVLKYCGIGSRITILRLGLVLGKGAYHTEWRRLLGLAQRRVLLSSNTRIHVTPARDVFRFVREALSSQGDFECLWIHLTPWRISLGELHRMIIAELGKKHLITLPVPSLLLALLAGRESIIHDKYEIKSRYKFVEEFEWTSPTVAVRELVEWCAENKCRP
jgi:nucleoside-diphosphate-sugar epimerase